MSNHEFDCYQLKRWLAGLEKPNEEEVCKALMGIEDDRISEIVFKRIYENKTYTALGKEYGVSRQRAHQLYMKGIKKIKEKLGLL